MSLTQSQRQRALSLYRRVLKAGQSTFAGDQTVIAAWHDKVRLSFLAGPDKLASEGKEAVEAKLKEWEDVIAILRKNIIQGQLQSDSETYRLRFTPETELGSNESVKQGRKQQLEALAANKGTSCRGSQTRAFHSASTSTLSMRSAGSSSAIAREARAFSTSSSLLKEARRQPVVPAPVPLFPSSTLLSDGSSVEFYTTSPRHVTKLTRDVTNHPLWNPSMERKGGGAADGEEEEAGRLGRFRRRFAEDFASAASDASESDPSAADSEAAPKQSGSRSGVAFGEDDLAWMSVGGRQARAGTPMSKAKAAKGKGRK